MVGLGVLAGILGYTGLSRAAPELLRVMDRMFYEGCDSWGMCTLDPAIHIRRSIEPFDRDREKAILPDLGGNAGLAHTRWGTHGQVGEINAHPILDCDRRFAVVHNGVITNHAAIRRKLEEKGHRFVTETDTEVIPHLIEDLVKAGNSTARAIAGAYEVLRGSYSYALVSTDEPECIFAVRRRHPVYIGRTSSSSVVTSEPSCVPGLAHQVAPLGSGCLAMLTPRSLEVADISSSEEVTPAWVGVDRRFLAETRMGYRHFLEKEISFAPEMLQIMALGDMIGVEIMAAAFDDADRVFLICDSDSYNGALAFSHLLGDVANVQSRIFPGSEFHQMKTRVSSDDVVIGLSSGQVEFGMIESLRMARLQGAHTAAVTGNGSRELMGLAEPVISLGRNGRKLSAMGSYVGHVGISLLLGHAIRGKVDRGVGELTEFGHSTKESMRSIMRSSHELASSILGFNSVLFFGRNTAYPVALEAAIDIRKLSDITSVGLETVNVGSQTYVRINDKAVCIFFVRKKDKAALQSVEEVRNTGATVVGVTESRSGIFDREIVVPESRNLFAISGIMPAQMLAYELSLLLGRNPDAIAFQG